MLLLQSYDGNDKYNTTVCNKNKNIVVYLNKHPIDVLRFLEHADHVKLFILR